jgi:hypothetical protein
LVAADDAGVLAGEASGGAFSVGDDVAGAVVAEGSVAASGAGVGVDTAVHAASKNEPMIIIRNDFQAILITSLVD